MSARETPARPALEPALPSSWYRSERVWEAEKERIFSREWVCAGREEQLADEPGAHRLLEVLGESIILVRNRERALRAFYNTCRHRGSRLCREESGGSAVPHLAGGLRGGRITCPYHQWTYDLDGRLVGAPHMAGVRLRKMKPPQVATPTG